MWTLYRSWGGLRATLRLTTSATLFAVSSWFGFSPRCTRRVTFATVRCVVDPHVHPNDVIVWVEVRSDERELVLGPRLQRTKQFGLRLFDNFDFRVVAVDTQVGEGPVGGFFN